MHHDDCDADVREFLGRVTEAYRMHLGDRLHAVWLVGSLAHGCYNRALSDLDLLVVVAERPDANSLRALGRHCVELSDLRPTLGDQETSVVTKAVLDPVLHPTPHVFQYSASWTARFRSAGFEPYEGKADPDIVADCVVARRCGVPLFGPTPSDVIGTIAWTDFLDSILDDLRGILEDDHLVTTPVYGVLNACRILRTLAEGEGTVVSKAAGAEWALGNVPPEHRPLIERARRAYLTTREVAPAEQETAGLAWAADRLRAFAGYVRSRVFPDAPSW